MLVNFRVVNFLSLAQLNTLSLVKGSSRQHANHIYKNKLINLLKFSAIYGANGAGKSNIIKAMKFSKEVISKILYLFILETIIAEQIKIIETKKQALSMKFS
jgi:AAA15 family ATPase/GTPase